MKIQDLKGKMVAVLGFGMEGRATAEYLIKHGVKPVLFDERPWENWPEEDKNYIKSLKVNFIFGPQAFMELKGFDLAFRSPGIKIKQLTTDLPRWQAGNLQLTSQTKWFFDNCPAKIIGVTGTKGKGTTASLIYEILNGQYQSIYLTGNIGKIQPLEILDGLEANDWVVYELSSFQLEDLHKSPHIGVVLMVTSEHLDYHLTADDYHQAKKAICAFQSLKDFCVINKDYPASLEIGQSGQGQKQYFSTQNKDADCYVENGLIMGKLNGSTVRQLADEPVIATQDLGLIGRHNWQNVCAAVLASLAAGAQKDAIVETLKNFKGLEHRLEFVTEKSGIKFYNDSFSTTPETAIAAIQAFNNPLVLILGGSSKKSDFTNLGKTINESKNIKAIILIGQEAGRIKHAIGKTETKILEGTKNMQEIFGQINSIAQKGDTVLLSPACASFDMFKSYKDRGEQFKEYAKNY